MQDISLGELFPNANSGLSQIGFFFGAGSSFPAGFPLTAKLTIEVLNKLTRDEIALVEKILREEGTLFDPTLGLPDIELLSDSLNKAKAIGGFQGIDLLLENIRGHIVTVINSVSSPDLEHHIRFLKGLKKLMSHRNECVWIFTTNYDLTFESAAAVAKIPIYNGFEGIGQRYFDMDRIDLTYGRINSNRMFEPFNEPHIKLIKLHGSISWFKNNGNVNELFSLGSPEERCMILPRRTKVTETLDHPYDKLFRYASSVIGKKCKFLVTCGYSFRDEHINDIIFSPKLRSNSIRVFALSKEETPEILRFRDYQSFHYLIENKLYFNGRESHGVFELWDFKKLAELINP